MEHESHRKDMEELAAHEESLRNLQLDYGKFVLEVKRQYVDILNVAGDVGGYDSHGEKRTAEGQFVISLLEGIQRSLDAGKTPEEVRANCRKRAKKLIEAYIHNNEEIDD